ncbi:LPS O-antigen chain length determinant protein WzzB [Legionella jamestowniensis]|uniref:Chain length determinant protein n=1 Tax=Legionella jamestowniensis TaxID=455 RepID=A0A0W0UFX7_9GAMM|nr:Wzz/FepE/Etk N-terminal domain-containing protein [Legionella jamestowniensis]KTD06827.1 Chain length determinant protein [Legionella jamestowniensis]SFL82610.1 chain length determinant protein (polysaccharide antigen chain regulator) [Legionella jamestowniensis DSM 19215]
MEGKHSVVMPNDEIDLVDLFRTIWKRKWFILFVIVIFGCLGGLYASFKKPIYEAKALLSAPSLADIALLNDGHSHGDTSLITPFSISEVYQIFTDNLLSEAIKRQFFHTIYLPSLKKDKQNSSLDKLYNRFLKKVSISEVSKSAMPKYLLKVENNNPSQAVQWLKEYISLVKKNTLNNLLKIIKQQHLTVAHDLKKQISFVRGIARKKRADRLAQLQEALKMAQTIGVKEPSISSLNGTLTDASTLNDPNMMYLRGSKALEVEIQNLSTRKSDDAFIPELRELEANYHFYKTSKIDYENIKTFHLDGAIKMPDMPISLPKSTIVLLSLLLGLLIGTMGVVLQYLWFKNKNN